MGLGHNACQPIWFHNGGYTGQLIPSNELCFVISHVEGREQSAHERVELMIRVVDHVVLILTVLFEVVEGDCVTLNAHLFDEIAQITP